MRTVETQIFERRRIKRILGIVCKVTSNKYKIYADGEYYVIPARGILKLNKNGIKVGDKVDFSNQVINSVVDRQSYFTRTNVANISCINVVVAPLPKPDFTLVDKMIVEAYSGGAKAILTVNKCETDDGLIDHCLQNYADAVDAIFVVSALRGEGLGKLEEYLSGEFCAFAGQSAVGKTSIVNAIFALDKSVNTLSEKTQRGRHTTTSREIHFKGNIAVIDTPGFSSVEVLNVKSADLNRYYKEFAPYNGKCYYIGCTHTAEPDCLVKDAVASGKISAERYLRYCDIYKEIKEYEKRKY